jgi:hypothetical protein
MAINRIP